MHVTPLVFSRHTIVLILLPLLAIGCNKPVPRSTDIPADPWFADVTEQAGIQFVHMRCQQTRYWLPEIVSGGLAWLDYDGDQDLDLYLVQGGDLSSRSSSAPGNALYENLGNGTFRDVTERAGVGDESYGMGVAIADYDGDGDEDIYVTNVGPNKLYRNRGDGTFEDVTAPAGVGDPGWGTSALFIDYDGDQNLDLYVVNYIRWSPEREFPCYRGGNLRDYCTPQAYDAPAPDRLYRSRGDGTFEDVSEQVGLDAAYGNGLGVVAGDFNGDGRIDFYVANDGTPNQLWIQDPQGRFHDMALISGCAVNQQGASEAGMGAAAVDVENDGDLDLFVTNLGGETNTLYLNHGGLFEDATAVSGLGAPSISFTGFGLGFADFDHDGQLDLYVANGRVGQMFEPVSSEDPFAEPNQLYRGLGGGRFVEVMPRGGTATPLVENSRAAAFGDYDNDGDLDVLIVNNGGRATLLNNRAGSRGHWIRLRVLDENGRETPGARVRATVGQHVQWRSVQRAYSFQASNEPYVHFGLADAIQVDDVTVIWLDGTSESFGPLAINRLHTLRRTKDRASAKAESAVPARQAANRPTHPGVVRELKVPSKG